MSNLDKIMRVATLIVGGIYLASISMTGIGFIVVAILGFIYYKRVWQRINTPGFGAGMLKYTCMVLINILMPLIQLIFVFCSCLYEHRLNTENMLIFLFVLALNIFIWRMAKKYILDRIVDSSRDMNIAKPVFWTIVSAGIYAIGTEWDLRIDVDNRSFELIPVEHKSDFIDLTFIDIPSTNQNFIESIIANQINPCVAPVLEQLGAYSNIMDNTSLDQINPTIVNMTNGFNSVKMHANGDLTSGSMDNIVGSVEYSDNIVTVKNGAGEIVAQKLRDSNVIYDVNGNTIAIIEQTNNDIRINRA